MIVTQSPKSLFFSAVVTAIVCAPLCLGQDKREQLAHFENEIRPVLVAKCIKCHGAKKQEGGLRLDSAAAIARGGESGATLVLGLPKESLMIEALKYEGFEMPPSGKLGERTIASFERWIAEGAVWPEPTALLREEAGPVSSEDRQWWAFQPLSNQQPPAVVDQDWPHNEIDHFVLQQLEAKGLRPAPPAEKSVLVRRLYFDVIGLPPSPSEVAEFVNDKSEHAVENLVDRLLDDPRYGEHWARYWLDLVRYCESDGWNQDAYRPQTWRYRDYVVNAFNDDKPYPTFVLEQLAGDELNAGNPERVNPEHLIAAGFLRLGIYEYNQRDARGHWNDIMNEMTDVVGDVFLGLSMSCARCHDHKFDPLPQRDYFKLRACFEPVIWRDDLRGVTLREEREYQQQLDKWELATVDIRGQLEALLRPYEDKKWAATVDKFPLDIQACFNKRPTERSSWEEQMSYLVARQYLEEGGGPFKTIKSEDKKKWDALEAELAAFDELKPAPLPEIATVSNHAYELSPTILPDDPEQRPIPPGFLVVMDHLDLPDFHPEQNFNRAAESLLISAKSNSTAGRRTQLARWIGNPENPLTTRVIVNRIWQQHFGTGLVASPSDFGRLGSPPSQPALLDWLSTYFVGQGWSFKQLHKQILLSATWQQASMHPQAGEYLELNPEENLIWRFHVRRLRAEQIRDAMLVASGEMQTFLGGPSVDEQASRRGLYVKSFRNNLDTFLHSFDMANGSKSVAERDATTTPTQALLLFNGEYSIARAEQMTKRLVREVGGNPDELLQRAFGIAWGRPASDSELNRAREYVGVSPGEDQVEVDHTRLADFCHVLFNSNEFLYVD